MTANLPSSGLQIHSTLEADGALRLELAEAPVSQPGDDQVVIAVEAAPINPSDMITMLVSANPVEARFEGQGEQSRVVAQLPPDIARVHAGRFGEPLSVGLEGAGTVIAAGANGEHLIGRKVAALSLERGSFGQYMTVNLSECAPLPEDVSVREGADLFCNPMTVMAIVETVRLEGHHAMVHTAAASNLGQMLIRVCREDGIPLVNVVRRQEQVDLLKQLGAEYVCNSTAPTFVEDLHKAVAETSATIAFDAIGGGMMVDRLHRAMEEAAVARMDYFSPYGSSDMKQVYIYGYLDHSPTVLHTSDYGLLWDVRHWYMGATLERVGPERSAELTQRIMAGLKTTFASHFAHEVSLADVLDRDTMIGYTRQATGEKYLINPQL